MSVAAALIRGSDDVLVPCCCEAESGMGTWGRSPLHDSAAAASAVLLANAKSRMLPYHAVGLPVRRTGLTIVLGEG